MKQCPDRQNGRCKLNTRCSSKCPSSKDVKSSNIPVRGDNEDVAVDSQVLAVSTTHIQAYRPGRQTTKELVDDRPGLDNSDELVSFPAKKASSITWLAEVEPCISLQRNVRRSPRTPDAHVCPRTRFRDWGEMPWLLGSVGYSETPSRQDVSVWQSSRVRMDTMLECTVLGCSARQVNSGRKIGS